MVNSSSNTISLQDVANATATQRWIEGQVNKGLFDGGTPSFENPNLAPNSNYANEFPTITNDINKGRVTFTTSQIDRIISGSGVGISVNDNPPKGEGLNIADFKNLGNNNSDDLTPPQSR